MYETAQQALREVWGYQEFRGEQVPVIDAVLAGRDGLAVMKTSGGKSLCYQVPAICRDGVTLVISPLIALMKDQVDALTARGVSATFINSAIESQEANARLSKAISGDYKLIYVSPERLQTESFMIAAAQMDIGMVAVDEAHCVSMWGSDFRPAYTRIADFIAAYQNLGNRRPQIFAFTATATAKIQDDIIENLGMREPSRHISSFDRGNITFDVRHSRDKVTDIIDIINTHPGDPTIIYCATVKAVDALHLQLTGNGVKAVKYHGRMPTEEKDLSQFAFQKNRSNIMVATNAFGMGVDKSDVRNVVHMHMPGTLESYYQEAGRAGRDGKPSRSFMLFSSRDRRLHEFFIQCANPAPDAVLSVQMVLAAMGDASVTLSSLDISNLSPTKIETFTVASTLRILEDHGCIKIHHFDREVTDRHNIEILEIDNPLDLSYLAQKRTVSLESLAAIESFCTTSECRRSSLLSHFGEVAAEDRCGACDTCLAHEMNASGASLSLPAEAAKSICAAIESGESRLSESWLVQILSGTRSALIKAGGFDQWPSFGALAQWRDSEISAALSCCKEERLYSVPGLSLNGAARITEKGRLVALGDVQPIIKCPPSLARHAVSSGAQHQTRVAGARGGEHVGRVAALAGLREQLAREQGKPMFQIFSDTVLQDLAQKDPRSKEDLPSCGLSYGRASLMGDRILDALRTERLVIKKESQQQFGF